jgi:hypothetical protein
VSLFLRLLPLGFTPFELVGGSTLILLLLSLVGYFSWQEIGNLRRLRSGTALGTDEYRRVRNRVIRRLFSCVLLLVLAGGLIGAGFLEGPLQQNLERSNDRDRNLDAEAIAFFNFYRYYWIVFMLILMALLAIVGYDLWIVRRWSIQEQRRILEDRREMIKQEVSIYRQQRNGHH